MTTDSNIPCLYFRFSIEFSHTYTPPFSSHCLSLVQLCALSSIHFAHILFEKEKKVTREKKERERSYERRSFRLHTSCAYTSDSTGFAHHIHRATDLDDASDALVVYDNVHCTYLFVTTTLSVYTLRSMYTFL